MKQEATKKSKLWLWIVIGAVALLAAAGVVLALVLGGTGEVDEGPKGGRPDLYWNVDRITYTKDSASGLSTREPGEDGLYHVRFAYNGSLVELAVIDKPLINFIDTMDAMGIVQDADGVVIDVLNPKDIATEKNKNAYVKEATATTIRANSSIAMNGMNITIQLSELTEIYDVTEDAKQPGKIVSYTDLKPMDNLTVYANDMDQVTHVYITSHAKESKIYWRANQMYNSTLKETSRVPDDNGVYSIDFFCDGELVTLKTKDKAIATTVDKASRWKCHFAFSFDEEGYIIEQFNSAIGIQGTTLADCWDIVAIDGDTYTIQRLVTNDGSVWTGTISADCLVYDASYAALSEGRQGKPISVSDLTVGDRVTVWGDANGIPKIIYVANHIVDVPAFWVPTRKYSTAKQSTTRVPNANGYYEVEAVQAGTTGLKTYYIKDKAIADYMDSISDKTYGFKVGPGNVIEYVYHNECLTGYTCKTQGGYVTAITGSIVTKISYGKRGSEVNLVMTPNVKIYDVSGFGQMGEETTIQVGDYIWGYAQPTGELTLVFVSRRTTSVNNLYWNLKLMYDSKNKVSTREPDEEGWYHFDFAHKGKQVSLKTKNKSVVEFIDKQSIGAVGLSVSGDVILKAYDPINTTGGKKIASGYRYDYKTSAGKYHCFYNSDKNKTVEFLMAEDCVIYNVSSVFENYKGEKISSIKKNDMLTVYTNCYGEAVVVYVRQRDVDNMYWKVDTMYDKDKDVTKRIPDADGYYWYDVAVNGKVKTLKTKDVSIANSMDSYSGAFGLNVKDDEILGFVSTSYVKNVKGNGLNGYCVTAINGNKITLTYNRPGSKFGETETITLTNKAKIYDVSASAKKFGAVATLKVGDTVRTYLSRDEVTHNYVYIIAHATREGGEAGYCEVCKKDVIWNPLVDFAAPITDTGHWYLTADMTSYVQYTFATKGKDYTVCIDLNGHTLTRPAPARMFRVAEGETVNLMDSVGGGKIVGGGGTNFAGGMILMSAGGKFNMYGGTLEIVESEQRTDNGGMVSMSGSGTEFNLYGGTVTGGLTWSRNADSAGKPITPANAYGGNFYVYSKATLNVYGGVIENGEARGDSFEVTSSTGTVSNKRYVGYGGNIYVTSGATLNIYDGAVIRGGLSSEHGGNIYQGESKSGGQASTINMYGGQILDGRCAGIGSTSYIGGNIYSYANMNLLGGTISGGKQLENSYDIFVHANNVGKIVIGDVTVAGRFRLNATNGLTLQGAPKLGQLDVYRNVKLTVDELKQGADIKVVAHSASPIFTTPFDMAKDYLDAGYFSAFDSSKTVVLTADNELMLDEAKIIKYCEICKQDVEWAEYPSGDETIVGAGDHYFLPEGGVKHTTGQVSLQGDITLDLNGQTLEGLENKRVWRIEGKLNIIDSVGGGKIVSHVLTANGGGVAMVWKNSVVNMYAGTVTTAADHNDASSGGLLSLSGGSVWNMYGGTIEGGSATGNGQNIYLSDATLNVEGGFIDGGIYTTSASTVKVSGNAKISKSNSGVKLADGKLITLGAMEDSAEVYVSGIGAITAKLDNAEDYLDNIKAAEEGFALINNGGILTLKDNSGSVYEQAKAMDFTTTDPDGKVTAKCPVCREEVEWLPLMSVNAENTDPNKGETSKSVGFADGNHHHYYLSSSVDYTANIGHYSITDKTKMCLHLNNQTIVSTYRTFFTEDNGTLLNIMGEGTVTGAGYTSGSTVRASMDGTAAISLYGGTYTNSSDRPVIWMRSGANVNCVLNVNEGTVIEGGSAQYALRVNNKSTINLNGGTVNGTVFCEADTAHLTVSGAPVVSNVELAGGALIEVGELTDGANITVTADGVFTKDIADAKAVKDFFHSAIAGKVVNVEGSALAIGEPSVQLSIYEQAKAMDFTTTDPDGKVNAVCPVCGGSQVWLPLPVVDDNNANASKRTYTLTAGSHHHYYLSKAVDYTQNTGYYSIKKDTQACINLNGQTIVSARRAFFTEGSTAVLNIMGEGTVAGAGESTANRAVFDGTAAINLYGGIYESNSEYPVIEMRSGTNPACVLSVYEGTVIQTETADCALQVLKKSSIRICGGSILGGSVINKEATANVTIEGAPVIEKLDLSNGVKITVGELTEGASIKVVAPKDAAFTNVIAENAETYATYFHVDDLYQGVVAKDNTLMITDICPHCNVPMADIEWKVLELVDNVPVTESGHFYLDKDYEGFTKQVSITAIDGDVVLDLKGHSFTGSGRGFYVGAESKDVGVNFSLLDTVGTAKVTTSYSSGGGVLYVIVPTASKVPNAKMNTLNVYGGTFTNIEEPNGGGCIRNLRATLNIYGGTFNGANITKTYKGGCLWATDATTTIYGGTFTEGVTGGLGDTFYIEGKSVLDIRGGNISGQVLISKANEVKISGAPVITDLELASGIKLTLGKLTEGADITVTADGEFAEGENAAAYVEANYIKAVTGKKINASGNVLSMTDENVLRQLAAFLGL